MRLAQSDLEAYADTNRGNRMLGQDAIHFLNEHPITHNIAPAMLGQTIRDLHHLISISNRILEITGYRLAVHRLQMIRHMANQLQIRFADQVADTTRNRLNLEDMLGDALPSSVDNTTFVITRDLVWAPPESASVQIPGNIIQQIVLDAQDRACTVQAFVAACFFLHASVSKLPPYQFVDSGQPPRTETKKRRQHLDMNDRANIGWLFDRMTRPLAERGAIAHKYAKSGYNYLLEQHRLNRIKLIVSAWILQMREKGETFNIHDLTKTFSISYAKYLALEDEMAMEGLLTHADLSAVRQRLPTFTLQPSLFEQLEAFAHQQGFSLHHALNEIVREFFERKSYTSMGTFIDQMISEGFINEEED